MVISSSSSSVYFYFEFICAELRILLVAVHRPLAGVSQKPLYTLLWLTGRVVMATVQHVLTKTRAWPFTDTSLDTRRPRRHLLLVEIYRRGRQKTPGKRQRVNPGESQRWAEPKPAATRLLLKMSPAAGTALRLLRGTVSLAEGFWRGSSPGGARWTAGPSRRKTCGHRVGTSHRRMCSDCGWLREVWLSLMSPVYDD